MTWTIPSPVSERFDPSLGKAKVVGGSRLWIAMATVGLVGLADAAWWVVQNAIGNPGAADPRAGQAAVAGALAGSLGYFLNRMRLVIGERGFRYERPLRRVELPWAEVHEPFVGQGGLRIVVPTKRKPADQLRLPNWFAVGASQICALMADARAKAG